MVVSNLLSTALSMDKLTLETVCYEHRRDQNSTFKKHMNSPILFVAARALEHIECDPTS